MTTTEPVDKPTSLLRELLDGIGPVLTLVFDFVLALTGKKKSRKYK